LHQGKIADATAGQVYANDMMLRNKAAILQQNIIEGSQEWQGYKVELMRLFYSRAKELTKERLLGAGTPMEQQPLLTQEQRLRLEDGTTVREGPLRLTADAASLGARALHGIRDNILNPAGAVQLGPSLFMSAGGRFESAIDVGDEEDKPAATRAYKPSNASSAVRRQNQADKSKKKRDNKLAEKRGIVPFRSSKK
jgi:hypothetical protein